MLACMDLTFRPLSGFSFFQIIDNGTRYGPTRTSSASYRTKSFESISVSQEMELDILDFLIYRYDIDRKRKVAIESLNNFSCDDVVMLCEKSIPTSGLMGLGLREALSTFRMTSASIAIVSCKCGHRDEGKKH